MMASTNEIMARFMAMKPAHVIPCFKTVEELMAFHRAEEKRISQLVTDRNRQARMEKIIGRAGIQPLHRECSFGNYEVETPEQQHAVDAAKQYLQAFGQTYGGFIFSGNPGTGKNHLATAIARNLMKRGKSVMIITVSELFEKFRQTYAKDSAVKETDLMRDVCKLDLLVLDEIGVQKGSEYEINLLTQIIDRRQLQLRPTGMLTNKNYAELVDLLRERIMDRQTNGGIWVPFSWQSYRVRKGGRV